MQPYGKLDFFGVLKQSGHWALSEACQREITQAEVHNEMLRADAPTLHAQALPLVGYSHIEWSLAGMT